jgi:YVTN family beta-propeller protein
MLGRGRHSYPHILVAFLLAAGVLCAPALGDFELPGAAGRAVWEAEEAEQVDAWEISAPGAKGARYVQPSTTHGEATLLFPFEAEGATTLRVRPVWWRNGEQKLARRFPYPLARKPGPDVVDFVGGKVFCTAPEAGNVLIVGAAEEKVVGSVAVGGYLTDLVADREAGKVYVADALGDRVVVINAERPSVVGGFSVSGSPWALALDGGTLYVACRDGKRVVALSAASGEVKGEAHFEAAPIGVALVGEGEKQLVVRFQEQAFDVFTLEELTPDEERFAALDMTGKPPAGCGGPTCDCKWVEAVGPHQIAIVSEKRREIVDVSVVTRRPEAAGLEGQLPENPGPCALAMMYIGEPPRKQVGFFTAPSRGLVGVVDLDNGVLEDPVLVGGYPAGLTRDEDNEKLYVCDAAGDRVVVIDAATRQVVREIAVAGQPWSVVLVKEVAWQRPGDWQPRRGEGPIIEPTQVNRLYVACRETEELVAIDLETEEVVARARLRGEPSRAEFVSMPSPAWWPVMADDRIPFALHPRLAVARRPVWIDPETLAATAAPSGTLDALPRRTEAQVPVGGATKTFAADNELVLGVDGERWIDLSEAADAQRMAARPLHAKEMPGTITVSLDEGPEYDWARSIWTAPDSELFLVNDSDEFWRYNAVSVPVEPGRHVLRVKAHSPYARFDALVVRRSLEPDLLMEVVPEPRAVHDQVPLASYQGVFYDEEPVRFTVAVTNRSEKPVRLQWGGSLRNYLGEVLEEFGDEEVLTVEGGDTVTMPLAFEPEETGRFALRVGCVSWGAPRGTLVRDVRFVRLPKLEHPRLFWRADEENDIRARIAQYPNLFRRYGEWLERMAQREGRFPERFLPPGITRDELMAAAPEDMPQWEKREGCGWRMYELGWRVLAAQFVQRFLKPDSATLSSKIEGLRGAERAQSYIQYHHHGPFFPGTAASLVDFAPGEARQEMKLDDFFEQHMGDTNTLPWTLVMIEEPLTPVKRALVYELATWTTNAERYFEARRGERGGPWWLDPYTGCRCPNSGYTISFVLMSNFLGEPRVFENPIFRGYLTFQRYADPIRDNRTLMPGRRGPNGEPWRWLLSALCRHPVDKSVYGWEEWVETMEGPLPDDEEAAVDSLMALEGRELAGPLYGNTHYFVSGVAVPVALALGWYDPGAPEVQPDELPPTAAFDVEGWVAMRSGWDFQATEVTFVSGVRDHTTRHKPNHVTIVKSGEFLLGTPSLLWDDGNNVGVWGNSVVVGDDWTEQWRMNLQHPRDGEHMVINRFSPWNWTYIARDRHMAGYRPSEQAWGGGLNLHGHTETMFMNEGRLLAYQTWPDLDYVAGDASNAWRCEEVAQLDRQLVFLKPDVVVVYDRVKLGPEADESRWLAATGLHLQIEGSTFRVLSRSRCLVGAVVLPDEAVLANPELPEDAWYWRGQQALEVRPPGPRDEVEYLVVMRVGEPWPAYPRPELIEREGRVGVRLTLEDREIAVAFNRGGAVGGRATIEADGTVSRYDLREEIVDSYAGWQDDPRHERWEQERFGFMVPEVAASSGRH